MNESLNLFLDASKRKPFVNTDILITQLGIKGIETLISELESSSNIAMLAGAAIPINVEQGTDYVLLNDTARHKIALKYESSFEAITFCFANRLYKQSKIIATLREKIQQRKNASLRKKNKGVLATITTNMATTKFMPFVEATKEQIVLMLSKDIDMFNTCIKTPSHMYFIDPISNQMVSISNETYIAAYAEANSLAERVIERPRQSRKPERLEIVL